MYAFLMLIFITSSTLKVFSQTKSKGITKGALPYTRQVARNTITGTGANASIKFGVPRPTGVPCQPGAGMCNLSGSGKLLGDGQPVTSFYMDASGNLDLMVHLDSLLSGSNADPFQYQYFKTIMGQGGVFSMGNSSVLPTSVCTPLKINSTNSGLYNSSTGLLIPQNTYCVISQPNDADSEYIQIMMYGLFNTTASNGNTVGVTFNMIGDEGSTIGSLSPLSTSAVNPTLIASGGGQVYLWMNYNNLIAAQPEMAKYFTLSEDGIVTEGNIVQADTFVFSSDYSFVSAVPQNCAIIPQTAKVVPSPNVNWFGVAYQTCTVTDEQATALKKRRAAKKKQTK